MSMGWYVTANDIKNWAQTNSREAQGILPRLIKDLIYASIGRSSIKSIYFPAGDNVSLSGWDGTLDVEVGNEYVPIGISGWECGTDQSVNAKAEDEYNKRTNNLEIINPSETTFVFVTPRIWQDKDRWCAEKESNKVWKKVKGINASDIESWLHQCPAVHKWFANLIGKRADNVLDIEEAWDSWTACTSIIPTPDFVLNGRKEEVQKLTELLLSEPRIIRIKAFSLEETFAFCLASIKSNESLVPRTLVVRDQNTWDTCVGSANSLVLIPKGFLPSGSIGYARNKGHSVILLSEINSSQGTDHDINIMKMSIEARIESLKSMGLTETDARKIYDETHGYFEPMRRHKILGPNDNMIPNWTNDYDKDVLVACLLATEWNTKKEKDKDVLARLANIDYEELEKRLIDLKNEKDPPIRLIGEIWQVVSKTDYWSLIEQKISKQNIDRLEGVVIDVLGETDPSFDLPPDERWLASIKSKVPEYSWNLKSGLADSLAFLSAFSDDISQSTGGSDIRGRINYWVRKLLEKDGSARSWFSLRHNLIPLAEAAPDSFLDAIESSIGGNATTIKPLFEGGTTIFSGVPHSSLLWALETLSWDFRYLSRVILVLARLSEIDPGGSYLNSPFNTLRNIFLGWVNNTKATYEERLRIMDTVLYRKFPNVMWELLISILPNNGPDFSIPIHEPKYNDWAIGLVKETDTREYAKYLTALADRVISFIENDPIARWPLVIKELPRLAAEQIDKAIDTALSIDRNKYDEKECMEISDNLRKLISNHREFKGPNWRMAKDKLDKLEGVHIHFKPINPVLSNLYLFNEHFPELIEPIIRIETNTKKTLEIIEEHRKYAVIEIYERKGISGIEDLACSCNYAGLVGATVAELKLRAPLESEVLQWLSSGKAKLIEASQGFIRVCFETDKEWVERTLESSGNWVKEKYINFLLGLPFGSYVFEILMGKDIETQGKYWRDVQFSVLREEDLGYANWVIERLYTYNRLLEAVYVASYATYHANFKEKLDCKLLANILKKIVLESMKADSKIFSNSSFKIMRIIEYIQNEGQLTKKELLNIEWMYVKIFRRDKVRPRTLISEILSNPMFFAELVSWIYYPENDEEEKEKMRDENSVRKAENARELLDLIPIVPGQNEDGAIDSSYFGEWLIAARAEIATRNRTRVGDAQIGELLSKSPPGTDGIWPHETVRDIVEEIQSKEIEEGLRVGRMNQRGGTWRSIHEGGKQERELATSYFEQANKIQLQYPRTATILRKIGNLYEREAKREDQEVEQRD